MGKKTIVSGTYETERISIKNSLPYLKCVLRLSCLVHRPTDLWPLNAWVFMPASGGQRADKTNGWGESEGRTLRLTQRKYHGGGGGGEGGLQPNT